MFADIQSRGHFSSNSTLTQAHTASLLPLCPPVTGLDYYQDPADRQTGGTGQKSDIIAVLRKQTKPG